MANEQYFKTFSQLSSVSCIVDLTPPVFAGIVSATPLNNGAINVAWALASDSTPPIEYLIYIALGVVSAATLFVPSNLVTISPNGTTSKKIFTLANQSTFIIKDQVYTLGVRARDGVGNIESNLVVTTATALGSVDLSNALQLLADTYDSLNDAHNIINENQNSLNNDLDLIISRAGSTSGIEANIDESVDIVAEFEDIEEI